MPLATASYLFCTVGWSFTSCCAVLHVYSSVHVTSCCQSYTHAVLHVGFTEERNQSLRLRRVACDIPHIACYHGIVGGSRCVTRVIQSCLSNHICLVFTMVTCSRVYWIQSLYCVSFRSRGVCPILAHGILERIAFPCPEGLLGAAH